MLSCYAAMDGGVNNALAEVLPRKTSIFKIIMDEDFE